MRSANMDSVIKGSGGGASKILNGLRVRYNILSKKKKERRVRKTITIDKASIDDEFS